MKTVQNLPKISIIIPAYNEEDYIGKCLQGLTEQYYPKDNIEVIVMDNGSSDRTREIASHWGAKVYCKPDFTIGALRNYGWKKSHNNLIAFLDADCVPCQNWLFLSVNYLNKTPDLAVISGILSTSLSPPWIEELWIKHLNSKFIEEITFEKTLASYCFVSSLGYLTKTGGFNEDLETCEDSDLGYRIAEHGKIAICRNIQIVHLDNAKTLRKFFFRQFWQGRSNLLNLFSHKINFAEIPSIVIPILFILNLGAAIVSFIFCNKLFSLALWFLLFCIPFLITFKKKRWVSTKQFMGYFTIWTIYLFARGMASFLPRIPKFKN